MLRRRRRRRRTTKSIQFQCLFVSFLLVDCFGRAVGRIFVWCFSFFFFYFIFMRVYCLSLCVCVYHIQNDIVRVWHNELKKSRDQFRNRRVREKYEIYVHSVRAHTEKRENNRSDCIYIFRLLSVHFSFFVGVGFFSRTWVCGRALTERKKEEKKNNFG